MKQALKTSLTTFIVELLAYGLLVAAYFFLVLKFCDDWLARLFEQERKIYAVVALSLIIIQGVGLEIVTRFLLRFIKPRTRDE
jgi:hypothetical protein